MIKYILLAGAMASDVLLVAATATVLYWGWQDPFVWAIVVFAYYEWHKTGGFENWNLASIRQYLKNADRYGL